MHVSGNPILVVGFFLFVLLTEGVGIFTRQQSHPSLPMFRSHSADTVPTSFSEGFQAIGLDLNKLLNMTQSEVERYMMLLYQHSERLARRRPPITNTTAPSLDPLDCSGPMFAGRRSSPATVVDLMPFNGEFDATISRFYELDAVVDMHIVLESPSSFHMFRKPMVLAQRMDYFRDFWHKMYLLYDDDSSVYRTFEERFREGGTDAAVSVRTESGKIDRRMEKRMRALIWSKAQVFVKDLKPSKVVYISGDPDEIPDRNMINHFRHCKPANQPFSYKYSQTMYRHNFQFVRTGGTWNRGSVFGGIGHPDLSIKELRDGKILAPSKWKGIHMNHVTDVYSDIAKELTMSESSQISKLGRCSQSGNVSEALLNPLLCNRLRNHGNRICCQDYPGPKVSSITDEPQPSALRIPWIVEQNRDHFREYFQGSFAPEQ